MSVPLLHEYGDWYYIFYVPRRYISYLLFLGAVWEILHFDYDENPPWTIPLIAFITLVAVFLPPFGLFYYLPRLPLFLITALFVTRAFRDKNLALFSLSLMSIGFVVTDALLFLNTGNNAVITQIQKTIALWWSTAFSATIIGGILWKALLELLRKELKIEVPAPAANGAASTVIPFPNAANSSTSAFDIMDQFESMERIGRIEEGMDDLEEFLKSAATASTINSKEYLSLDDIAAYLNIPPELAMIFIDIHGIKRIYPVKGEDYWVVSKSDIKQAMSEEEEDF